MNHANDAYCTICKKTTPHDAVRPGQPRTCILCGRHVVKADAALVGVGETEVDGG